MSPRITIDDAAVRSLGAPGSDVDLYIEGLAYDVYDVSQQLVPQPGRSKGYATGQLHSSGAVGRQGTVWGVEYGTDHAIYVEMGTRHMEPEPYLRPALAAVIHT